MLWQTLALTILVRVSMCITNTHSVVVAGGHSLRKHGHSDTVQQRRGNLVVACMHRSPSMSRPVSVLYLSTHSTHTHARMQGVSEYLYASTIMRPHSMLVCISSCAAKLPQRLCEADTLLSASHHVRLVQFTHLSVKLFGK